jgi:hypothetical protein
MSLSPWGTGKFLTLDPVHVCLNIQQQTQGNLHMDFLSSISAKLLPVGYF